MTGFLGYRRLRRRLWHIDCTERTILFKERHRVSPGMLLLLYLGAVGLILLLGLPSGLGILKRGGGPSSWTAIFIAANGFAIFFTALAVIGSRSTVISLDPGHLHVAYRGIDLHDITHWQRVDGPETSKWRRKLLKPMGYSPISIGGWFARGNVANAFCPPWMRTALLIELQGLREPEHVLVGTRWPEEFEAALVQATSKLGPRQMDLSWLDDLKP